MDLRCPGCERRLRTEADSATVDRTSCPVCGHSLQGAAQIVSGPWRIVPLSAMASEGGPPGVALMAGVASRSAEQAGAIASGSGAEAMPLVATPAVHRPDQPAPRDLTPPPPSLPAVRHTPPPEPEAFREEHPEEERPETDTATRGIPFLEEATPPPARTIPVPVNVERAPATSILKAPEASAKTPEPPAPVGEGPFPSFPVQEVHVQKAEIRPAVENVPVAISSTPAVPAHPEASFGRKAAPKRAAEKAAAAEPEILLARPTRSMEAPAERARERAPARAAERRPGASAARRGAFAFAGGMAGLAAALGVLRYQGGIDPGAGDLQALMSSIDPGAVVLAAVLTVAGILAGLLLAAPRQ